MKSSQIAKELEDAARQLDVRVRREKGNFRGGYCIRNGEEILMLNRQHPPEIHVAVLAEALKNLPVDSVYLRPAVRQALEETWKANALLEFETEDDD
ncbi:MAG: hypothetical protein BMS9Abin05_0169 [Rhodothermia bacterium]|nr:MAG: hypothetical protein BMS9Abin05_0169 [Rhodothermia bacterium]